MPKTAALTDAEIAARLRLSATRLARRLRKESGSGPVTPASCRPSPPSTTTAR